MDASVIPGKIKDFCFKVANYTSHTRVNKPKE
jgi:hypothetical protein